jgi:hypothetical protein
MVYLKGSLQIKETDAKISRDILQALLPQVDLYFKKIFKNVSGKIEALVINAIMAAPEYGSLLSGQLKAEFGLPDSDTRVNAIVDFCKKIQVSYKDVKVSNNSIKGGFTINMIKSDFSDILSLSVASFTTEKGDTLNWLEWLLLFGNKTIIKDYTVQLGPNPRSRTGMAVMKGVISGKWGVPNEFAGTISNNWITRSIDSVDSQIQKLLLDSFKV